MNIVSSFFEEEGMFYKVLTKLTDNIVWDLIFHYHLTLSKKGNQPQKLLFSVYIYIKKKACIFGIYDLAMFLK